MLLRMQMHLGVVVTFVVCVCLVGFTYTAAKCVPEKCGSMSVSYPFWINNSDCGYSGFQINCTRNKNTGMMAPSLIAYLGNFTQDFLPGYDYNIIEIDYEGHLIINSTSIKAYSCDVATTTPKFFQPRHDGPFTISMSNKFVVIGCKTFGTYANGKWGDARCVSTCISQINPPYCRYGCCEITFPDNWKYLNFTGGGMFTLDGYEKCGFSTILDPSTFTVVDNETNLFWEEGRKAYYGLRLNWGISLQNCSAAKNTANYSCSSKAECIDSPSGKGHVCKSLPGYEGNGYLNGTDCTDINECSSKTLNVCVGEELGGICLNSAGSYTCSCANGYKGNGYSNGNGCRDIDECSDTNRRMCVEGEEGGICHNFLGSYTCSCAKGYKGDGFKNGSRCESQSSNKTAIAAAIGSVSSFVVISLAASVLVWWLKKRHLEFVEAKYFQQLQQYIASTVWRETLRLFSAKELAKASNNYSNEMVLGSGGFGTVFKGILMDGTSVAIKKSKQAFSVEDGHDFLNEVTILSQINHRNIVKLLGCCIQTKFPLLVSEFVPNGTLLEHLQSKERCLHWASRLQIAIETAEALAYLHSGASQPIFHRDVKSSNILLSETFSPKVADFGISRLISTSNDTHLTTNIMGTRGYLDPEYFQTYQLTDKSDVYSFGVVLLELITALEPLSAERTSEDWSLSNLFLSRVNNNRLREILDSKVLEEDNQQQMEDVGMLARECLHLERRRRPSMKEVVEELLWVRGGARKKRVRESVKCDDAVVEQTGISVEASQTSYKFRSYTFPSSVESTPEEPFTALIEMSTRSEQVSSKESISSC